MKHVLYKNGGRELANIYCCICGKQLKKIAVNKFLIKGREFVCFDCVKKAGHNPFTWAGNLQTTSDDIRAEITMNERGDGTAPKEKQLHGYVPPVSSHFEKTSTSYDVGNAESATSSQIVTSIPHKIEVPKAVQKYLQIDFRNLWYVTPKLFKEPVKHHIEDIISFELLEDGNTVIKGGLGGAVAGGLLFGGVGAVVGSAASKRKVHETCRSLRIKITVCDVKHPTEYIDLLTMGSIDKSSWSYRNLMQRAQEIISTLQVLQDAANKEKKRTVQYAPVQNMSAADEIMKFKKLLDNGIITREEFEEQKRKLLK